MEWNTEFIILCLITALKMTEILLRENNELNDTTNEIIISTYDTYRFYGLLCLTAEVFNSLLLNNVDVIKVSFNFFKIILSNEMLIDSIKHVNHLNYCKNTNLLSYTLNNPDLLKFIIKSVLRNT